jgi:outer membrane lipoprotein-sorting protein
MRFFSIVVAFALAVFLAGVSGAQHQDRFHNMGSSPKMNYDSLAAAAVPLSESAEGSAVVDNCIRSYGGAEQLRTLKDFELTYKATSRFGGEPYELVKMFQRGRRYKISRLSEERIMNGESCWFQSDDTLMALDRGRYRAELYSYLTLAMPLAIRTERFDSIRYGELPDDPLAYIYLDKQDSLMVVLAIDRENYLIRSATGVIRQGDENYVFINRFTDYQQHDGFRFPGQVSTISLGLEVSAAKLTGVKVNPGFGDKDFKP